MTLRAAHLFTDDWTVAGALVSSVAAVVAAVALARLADFEGPRGAGWRAVAALLLWPTSVFLFAGYSETLFLAFAIPAWLAARRDRWPLAAGLAACASCVRITGLFLALALVVEFFTSRSPERGPERGPERRPVRQAGWLAVPFVPLALSAVWQRVRGGDWLDWRQAQEAGWGRHLAWPWESLATTWQAAMGDGRFVWIFRLELAGALVGIGLVLLLLRLRRWSELVYVGLQVGALVCSAYYLSIPRAALLWWPVFLLVGRASTPAPPRLPGWRQWPRHWGIVVYALVAGPLMALNTLTLLDGVWAG
ncbi:hypothetical protein [Streptosporangium carneum]|uniref:Glycosyltransferase RgtA/B/C/D-like domain-containing protein n=1 Tax=Streptosporangium carneum TaxID=47481 RepID=A0A9W6HV49_9ACTN|nr:hypothetical protein [Streptosporangium carneum]GLK06916.1 hypothetical protein GCM10017600_03210 [Streptosporangium carneum]